MFLWFVLRQAAVMRYSLYNTLFEDSDPIKWKAHEQAIKAFYGF